MHLSETSIVEYHRLVFRQNNVRSAWQSFVIFTIPESHRELILSHQFLWLSICTPEPRHVVTAFFVSMIVNHFLLVHPERIHVVIQFTSIILLHIYTKNRS